MAAIASAAPSRERLALVTALELVKNDGHAATFQTLGQYRTSLIDYLTGALLGDEAPVVEQPR